MTKRARELIVWGWDTAERAGFTFLEAWIAAWALLTDRTVGDLFDPQVVGAGVGAAVLAIGKAVAARQVGESKASASALLGADPISDPDQLGPP